MFLHCQAAQFLGGVVGFVGGEAADVGEPLSGEVVVVDGDGINGTAEVVGVALVELGADGFAGGGDSGDKCVLVVF